MLCNYYTPGKMSMWKLFILCSIYDLISSALGSWYTSFKMKRAVSSERLQYQERKNTLIQRCSLDVSTLSIYSIICSISSQSINRNNWFSSANEFLHHLLLIFSLHNVLGSATKIGLTSSRDDCWEQIDTHSVSQSASLAGRSQSSGLD